MTNNKIQVYQKQILILENSIKSLSFQKVTTFDLRLKIIELNKKIELLLQKSKNSKIKNKDLKI